MEEIVESETRYQRLQPLTVEQEVSIALAAIRFFMPTQYTENCRMIEVTPPAENVIQPFSVMQFFHFLEVPGVLPHGILDEPWRYFQRINELLHRLERAGLLSALSSSGSVLGDGYYIAMYEATTIESQGALFLARAFGCRFLHRMYQPGTYQITGFTPDGDEHAGTAIAIAPRWLMTCAHVLNDMNVNAQQESPTLGYSYRVLRQVPHTSVDVGLIEVDQDLPVVQGLNFRDPHVGERVYTFGFPRIPLSRDATFVIQGGEVSVERMTALHGEELFLFSAIARPGNSGGPILSENGHVVGIVTQELSERCTSARETVVQAIGKLAEGSTSKLTSIENVIGTIVQAISTLPGDVSPAQPFHAGIATTTLANAIDELDCGVRLPVETWK